MMCAMSGLIVFALWMLGYALGLIVWHIIWSKIHYDTPSKLT
jgi:hypothetical protein